MEAIKAMEMGPVMEVAAGAYARVAPEA
jgi:hypothetical protein